MKNKLNILLFLSTPPPMNGASYANDLLIKSSFRKEFNISHVNCRFTNDNTMLNQFTFRKISYFVFYLFQLIRLLISNKFDFVIFNLNSKKRPFIKDSFYILVVFFLFRCKIIIWLHENNFKFLYESSGLLFKKYMLLTFRSFYYLVTVGNKLIDDVDQLITRNKIIAIHNGIPNIKDFTVSKEKRYDKMTRVLYLSHMDNKKGWIILLEAAIKICSIRKDVVFNFYGGISGSTKIESIVEKFNNTGFPMRILYRGPVFGEDKIKVIKTSDIFCFPSLFDSFPLVVLEAMRAGLPVITTNLGAISEAIENGKGGILVERHNSNALVRAIITLLENPIERKLMGQYNKKRFEKHFTLEAFVMRWVDFINKLSMKSQTEN